MADTLSYGETEAEILRPVHPRRRARPQRRNEWISWAKLPNLAKRPGRHRIGPRCYLETASPGQASVAYRFRSPVSGKDRLISLGPYELLTEIEVQAKIIELRRKVRDGIDPLDEKAALKATAAAEKAQRKTVAEMIYLHLASRAPERANAKHDDQWQSTLERLVVPAIGHLPLLSLTVNDVAGALRPHYETIPQTANRTRGRLEAVINHAIALGLFHGANPARWSVLKNLLPRPRAVKELKHHPACPWKETPAVFAELREQNGVAPRLAEFEILTATRSGEVRGARWREINLADAIWTIPASRTKTGKEHLVPLSDAAVDVLRTMQPYRRSDGDLIFPGMKPNVPLSDVTVGNVLKRMGRTTFVMHGFRSTFRDWAAETTEFDNSVLEKALGHAVPSQVEAAYRRGNLFTKRVALMAQWADYCLSASIGET
jgi:integrase